MTLSNHNQRAESFIKTVADTAECSVPQLSEVISPSIEKFDFLRGMAKKLGFNSALLSGALGLGALENLVAPSVARGEIISFFGTQEEAKARGAQHTAQFGGNSVYIRADVTIPGVGAFTDYFSGFLVNENRVGSAAHPFSALAPYNPVYSVGLSADYKSPTIEIPLRSFEFHPSYQGGVGGAGYDLARGELEYAAAGIRDIAFWSGPTPSAGMDILKVGYGLSGTPAGYDFSDQGAARGVFSTLTDLDPVLGAKGRLFVSQMDPLRPDGGKAANRDSGGEGLVFNTEKNMYELAFMQIGGANQPSVPYTELMYLDSEARSFLTVTSVPEPSSFVMAAVAAAGFGLYRFARGNKGRKQ